MLGVSTSRYQILDKHGIIDMFCSKWNSHRISHLTFDTCDIALSQTSPLIHVILLCLRLRLWYMWYCSVSDFTFDTCDIALSQTSPSIHVILLCLRLHLRYMWYCSVSDFTFDTCDIALSQTSPLIHMILLCLRLHLQYIWYCSEKSILVKQINDSIYLLLFLYLFNILLVFFYTAQWRN